MVWTRPCQWVRPSAAQWLWADSSPQRWHGSIAMPRPIPLGWWVKLAAGILVHNMFQHGRFEVFQRTLDSLVSQDADMALYVVDNGSSDDSAAYVASLGGTLLHDPITTCGHGMNATIGILAASGCDLVVFSNDDILWQPGSLAALQRFWIEAPDDVLIASGLLEEHFPWNTARELITCGGVKGLIRDTAPGGAWTLRAKDWPRIGPVPEAPGWDDVPTCDRLRRKGYRVAQLDLATHVGEGISTWGNDSARHGKPLDRAAWGLP